MAGMTAGVVPAGVCYYAGGCRDQRVCAGAAGGAGADHARPQHAAVDVRPVPRLAQQANLLAHHATLAERAAQHGGVRVELPTNQASRQ